jgi:hypothetical protein
VQTISNNGLCLFVNNQEYFLPFESFPWFKNARVSEVQTVVLNHEHHLHWPDLDIDLELDSIINPKNYPNIYR